MNCWYCDEQLNWEDDTFEVSTGVLKTTLRCPKCNVHVEIYKPYVPNSTKGDPLHGTV